MKKKVLYVVHNHPAFSPGGAEIYALDVYEQMKSSQDFEPVLLARTGPQNGLRGWPHPGLRLARFNSDPNQYLIYSDPTEFDWFYGVSRTKDLVVRHYREFLLAIQPDVVHFQHTAGLGYDLIRETRNTLPNAAIVYTLHEYLPICLHDGQMVRRRSLELCRGESPAACRQCYPDTPASSFFLRKHFIQSHFRLVDLFLSPSRFLRDRYIEWGIPEDKIVFEENGRPLGAAVACQARPVRNRLAFFGQLGVYKGVDVLLKAMRLLGGAGWGNVFEKGSPHLWLHGANLEHQPEVFRNTVEQLLGATRKNVTMVGRYRQDELPRLMRDIDWVVIPSIWWENSPLVIQEAYANGRPVICSDIGGMAEKVKDGVTGLHFRTGDATALAEVIERAVATEGLWDRLNSGIPRVYGIAPASGNLAKMYRALLSPRSSKCGGAQSEKSSKPAPKLVQESAG